MGTTLPGWVQRVERLARQAELRTFHSSRGGGHDRGCRRGLHWYRQGGGSGPQGEAAGGKFERRIHGGCGNGGNGRHRQGGKIREDGFRHWRLFLRGRGLDRWPGLRMDNRLRLFVRNDRCHLRDRSGSVRSGRDFNDRGHGFRLNRRRFRNHLSYWLRLHGKGCLRFHNGSRFRHGFHFHSRFGFRFRLRDHRREGRGLGNALRPGFLVQPQRVAPVRQMEPGLWPGAGAKPERESPSPAASGVIWARFPDPARG